MAADKSTDPFRDLVFSGAPSEYRLFRRRILLSVASLEEKHVRLAGPKILARLSGEAWRATEHLSVGQLRSENGWLTVLQALDDHYRYLPETELNECVDEFLFHLTWRRTHCVCFQVQGCSGETGNARSSGQGCAERDQAA